MLYSIRHVLLFSLLFLFLFSVGCSTNSIADKASDCYIMYDAGSSGTRLFIYQKIGEGWLEHEGPKVGALATPIRQANGKLGEVTDSVVNALDDMKERGVDNSGKELWKAFDWQTQCSKVVSAKVYATAGMRIAEQNDSAASKALWAMLEQQLKVKMEKVGYAVEIDVRTISGYEEGLYAWLAVRKEEEKGDFGIVEMGGASSQITFPCSRCALADDAVNSIRIGGEQHRLYSYSFLGVGKEEAVKVFGMAPACQFEVKKKDNDWEESLCANQITLTKDNDTKIRDPYNYHGGERDTYVALPLSLGDPSRWFLTGAFQFHNKGMVSNCCELGDRAECKFETEGSCFNAVYLDKYSRVLGVEGSPVKKVSWTLGAVICDDNDCLREANPPVCRWLADGCLYERF